MRFNTKITTTILEMATIPLVISGFIAYSTMEMEMEMKRNTLTRIDTIAQIQKNRLVETLANKEMFLEMFLGKTSLRANTQSFVKKPTPELRANINAILLDTKNSSNGIQQIWIADTNGTIISSTDNSLIGKNVSTEEVFRKGIQKIDVSTLKKENGITSQYLTGPLVLNGEILGVAALAVSPEDIIGVANDYSGLGETGETLLAENDGKGNALFITSVCFDKNAAFTRIVPKEEISVPSVHAIAGEEVIMTDAMDYRGVPVFAATRFIPGPNWGIVVKIDQQEVYTPAKKAAELFLFLTIMAILLICVVAISVSRSITGPIRKLTELAKRITKGDFSQSVVLTSHDEIGDLSHSFNTMIESIKEARHDVDEKVRVQTADILAKEKKLEQSAKTSADLAKDLAKFKLAADNVSEQIVITDPEGVVLYGNKMMEKITGYTVEETLGKKAGILWKHPMSKEYYDEIWRVIKTEKKTFRGQLQNRRKNGVVYEADVSISPVLDSDNNIIFYVSIERDITREKEIDRAKTEFVSLSSHQLRTPLSSINWNTEMLLNGDAGPMNEKQMQFLKEVYSSSQRMIALINAFLDVSRIEIGTFSGDPKPVNINEAAQDILREFHPMLEKRKQHISENYDPKIPTISTDIKTIHAIFQNLLSNAAKYTKEGGEIRVETTLSADGKDVIIEVSDNGIGIPNDQKHQIFERFFRTEVAREIDTDGTGLGLYFLKLITDKVGGTITFNSELNKGTTFFITLPIEGLTSKDEKSLKPSA